MKEFATVTNRHGSFFVDFTSKDKGKLTLFIKHKGALVPFAEIPVMSRNDILKFWSRYAVYIKALAELNSIPHTVKFLMEPEKMAKDWEFEDKRKLPPEERETAKPRVWKKESLWETTKKKKSLY